MEDAEAVCLEEVAHQGGDLGLVLDDEHERAGSTRDGMHEHSVVHRRPRDGDFRRLFAPRSHEIELDRRP
jgi:hypothetical protein